MSSMLFETVKSVLVIKLAPFCLGELNSGLIEVEGDKPKVAK